MNEGSNGNSQSDSGIHYRSHADARSSHRQIADVVAKLVAAGRGPVLDVGCAQGMLGEALAKSSGGNRADIDGIEPNPAWVERAKPFYRELWTATVEAAPLASKSYGVVVCGDVLEHLADPVGVLKTLRLAARDDATFIISVPNVAHLSVRMMLLFGKLPKMDRGILDRTHLQFFTKDTATQMLQHAGLRVERVLTTPVPFDEILKRDHGVVFNTLMKSQHVLIDVLPRLFTMQWIFLARPLSEPAQETT